MGKTIPASPQYILEIEIDYEKDKYNNTSAPCSGRAELLQQTGSPGFQLP